MLTLNRPNDLLKQKHGYLHFISILIEPSSFEIFLTGCDVTMCGLGLEILLDLYL